jgi:hypothetical protein
MKRPSPTEIKNLVSSLAVQHGAAVPIKLVIEAVRRAAGCSRATAYRALADAIAAAAWVGPRGGRVRILVSAGGRPFVSDRRCLTVGRSTDGVGDLRLPFACVARFGASESR